MDNGMNNISRSLLYLLKSTSPLKTIEMGRSNGLVLTNLTYLNTTGLNEPLFHIFIFRFSFACKKGTDVRKFSCTKRVAPSFLRPVHQIRFEGSDSWFQKLDAGVQTVRFQGSVFVPGLVLVF